jgi:galactoside O-acetyltransferase
MAWMSRRKLRQLGFAHLGAEVKVSTRSVIYNPERTEIGDYSRIDDFCVLSAGAGGIHIGSFVHVAVYSSLIGQGAIRIGDFSMTSGRVSVYSSNDDYSGERMTNPTVPPEFTGVTHASVDIGRHVVIGTGSVILPGSVLEAGVAVGALSLVTGRCEAFGVYVGTPARRVKERKKGLLDLEARLADVLRRRP